MGKGEIYTQEINSDDLPGFIIRNALIGSNNYLHNKWREDKERFYSKIYFALSLSLTILASLFVSWISILLLLNALTVLLIISAKKFKKQEKRFWENRGKTQKSFKDWNIKWKD